MGLSNLPPGCTNAEIERQFGGNGDCSTCYWYSWDEDGLCHNEGAEYLQSMEPDESCTLWEED